MATLNNLDEKDPNQQPGAPVNVAGTAGASASGGQGGAATPQSPVASNNTAPQANTGYTDVATYLDANKSGSAQLGDMVSSNLTDQYNTTKSGIDASAKGVQDAAGKGYVPENTDLIKQVISDPVSAAGNADTSAAVKAQLNSRYTGPQDWADLGTQQGKVNEAMQKGSLATAPGGLNVLAQEAEGKTGRGQSQGINQLDTLLLSGSPDAMTSVQKAADPFKTLNDYINEQNTAVKANITGAQTAADQARTHAQDAFTGAADDLTKTVTTGAEQAESARQAYNDKINQFYSTAVPIEQQINAFLGMAPNGAGASVTDPFAPIIRDNAPIASPVSVANHATPEQYQRALALQSLAGGTLNIPLSADTQAQAGTAPTVPDQQIPDIKALLHSLAGPLGGVAQKAYPNGSGWNAGTQAMNDAQRNLAQYLSQFDPEDYKVNPGGFQI